MARKKNRRSNEKPVISSVRARPVAHVVAKRGKGRKGRQSTACRGRLILVLVKREDGTSESYYVGANKRLGRSKAGLQPLQEAAKIANSINKAVARLDLKKEKPESISIRQLLPG